MEGQPWGPNRSISGIKERKSGKWILLRRWWCKCWASRENRTLVSKGWEPRRKSPDIDLWPSPWASEHTLTQESIHTWGEWATTLYMPWESSKQEEDNHKDLSANLFVHSFAHSFIFQCQWSTSSFPPLISGSLPPSRTPALGESDVPFLD